MSGLRTRAPGLGVRGVFGAGSVSTSSASLLLPRSCYRRKRTNELDEDDDANGLKNNRLDVVREEAWRLCWLTV